MAKRTVRNSDSARDARSHGGPRLGSPLSPPPHVAERTLRSAGHWTFLSNHAHVLIVLARDPSMILRDVAAQVGITERAVQRIIVDLESEGFIEREKIGRRNQYKIRADRHLRHAIESHRTIGDLITLVMTEARGRRLQT